MAHRVANPNLKFRILRSSYQIFPFLYRATEFPAPGRIAKHFAAWRAAAARPRCKRERIVQSGNRACARPGHSSFLPTRTKPRSREIHGEFHHRGSDLFEALALLRHMAGVKESRNVTPPPWPSSWRSTNEISRGKRSFILHDLVARDSEKKRWQCASVPCRLCRSSRTRVMKRPEQFLPLPRNCRSCEMQSCKRYKRPMPAIKL